MVVVLCALAALRVFLFSAAFPFFSNVDEQGHFDLVCKYARGHIPAGLEPWDADAAGLIVLYDTPEYFENPDRYPGGVFPPPHRVVTVDDRVAFKRQVQLLLASDNYESTQPPLYYAVAGAWYRLGRGLGMRGGQALYWTRFLNVLVSGLMTWVAYLVASAAFPHDTFKRLGVPLLIAFIPQDALYVVDNDVLLPLFNGAAFLCLLLVGRKTSRSYAFHAGTGLLIAASFLVKFSCVAVLPLAVGMVGWSILRSTRSESPRETLAKSAALFAAASVPIGVWCVRNQVLMNDITGSSVKTRFLGWTLKPPSVLLDHPIFGISGMTTFWRETLATFWRGELVWGLRPIASTSWDVFFGVSSLVFLFAAMTVSRTRQRTDQSADRSVLWWSLASFALSLGFLVAISIVYDFGDSFYPSRAKPLLISGRLASGALIPFATLYVSGLDALWPRRLAPALRWAALLIMVGLMTYSEVEMSGMAFASAYNWFHLM